MPRPTKFTGERPQRIRALVAAGCPMTEIAKREGIGRTTAARYAKRVAEHDEKARARLAPAEVEPGPAEPSPYDDPRVALGFALGRASAVREIASFLEGPDAEPITSAAAPELRAMADRALAPIKAA